MDSILCPAPNNVLEGETIYVYANAPLINPMSDGIIFVILPDNRRWVFPDGLLYYTVDVGYMPPIQFLEDIKRSDLEIRRIQNRGGEEQSYPDMYSNLLGGRIGFLTQDQVNSERRTPWGNCERFTAFLQNIRSNVLEKARDPEVRPDPKIADFIEQLNAPAIAQRANLGNDRAPLTLPEEEILRAHPVQVRAAIEDNALKLKLFGIRNTQQLQLWEQAVLLGEWDDNVTMEREPDAAGVNNVSISFSGDRDDGYGLSTALAFIDEFQQPEYLNLSPARYIGGYYTPEGVEITNGNFLAEVGSLLRNAEAFQEAETQGNSTEEAPEPPNRKDRNTEPLDAAEIIGECKKYRNEVSKISFETDNPSEDIASRLEADAAAFRAAVENWCARTGVSAYVEDTGGLRIEREMKSLFEDLSNACKYPEYPGPNEPQDARDVKRELETTYAYLTSPGVRESLEKSSQTGSQSQSNEASIRSFGERFKGAVSWLETLVPRVVEQATRKQNRRGK